MRYSGLVRAVAAAREGNADIIAALLEKCADPTLRTSKGEQPLHCACASGQTACVEVLLGVEGVDVNAPGPYKATPLHVASTPAVAEMLLDAGADPTIKYRSRDPATHHSEKDNPATARAIRQWKPGPQPSGESAAKAAKLKEAAVEEARSAIVTFMSHPLQSTR